MKNQAPSTLQVPAIQVSQSGRRVLYSFAVDGKLVSSFATVSRISRANDTGLDGYQRPEVLAHVQEIRDYLESESPMLPNAIVIAFVCQLDFKPLKPLKHGVLGILSVPISGEEVPAEQRPGFVVDGQQRLAAIREASIASFPIFISAFVVDDEREQTEQFILVNSTKPLPKALIYELLPSTDATLPAVLERRRVPASLLARLNHDRSSPLFESVRTVTNPSGRIKDNSLLKMLENSLSNGVLRRLQGSSEVPSDDMFHVVCEFWRAVVKVFHEAWALPPRRSRLMHGAGVISLGFLMDSIADRHREHGVPTAEVFANDLALIAPVCRWTSGEWDFANGARAWNEIQNTPKDIALLADYLTDEYKVVSGRRQASPAAVRRKSRSVPAKNAARSSAPNRARTRA